MPLWAVLRREPVAIASCVVLVTTLAWAYLLQIESRMSGASGTLMAEMVGAMATPRGPLDVSLAFVMWAVMMVGMMTAPAAPVLLLFAQTRSSSGTKRPPTAVLLFALGYVVVWLEFSALATLLQWALHEAALLSPAMAAASPYLAGGILIAAGVYQLTPLKRACLTECQSPLGFLMTNWRPGNLGAFRMGLQHGAYCVGCCWALMLLLFVVGVMSLAWVGVLAIFILLEKIAPSGVFLSRAAAAVMIAFGIVLIAI